MPDTDTFFDLAAPRSTSYAGEGRWATKFVFFSARDLATQDPAAGMPLGEATVESRPTLLLVAPGSGATARPAVAALDNPADTGGVEWNTREVAKQLGVRLFASAEERALVTEEDSEEAALLREDDVHEARLALDRAGKRYHSSKLTVGGANGRLSVP